jgi:hypothetical protein
MFFAAVTGVLCALVMGGIWLWRGMPSAAAATVLWFVYALYELLQFVRLICAGNCDGRIDYFLVWPLLLIFTGLALKHSLLVGRD